MLLARDRVRYPYVPVRTVVLHHDIAYRKHVIRNIHNMSGAGLVVTVLRMLYLRTVLLYELVPAIQNVSELCAEAWHEDDFCFDISKSSDHLQFFAFIMPDNDESVYNDLVGFLKSDRADLREAATNVVVAVQDRDNIENLIKYGAVEPLTRLISNPGKIGLNALKSLVNFSALPVSALQCVEDCIASGAIPRASEIALSVTEEDLRHDKVSAARTNAAVSLLANITRSEKGAVELLGPSDFSKGKIEGESKPIMSLMLSRFLSSSGKSHSSFPTDSHTQEVDDPYQHVADMVEENEEVGEKFSECVQFLRRDEEGADEGSSDRMVDNTWKKNLLDSSSTPLLKYGTTLEEDFDDVD